MSDVFTKNLSAVRLQGLVAILFGFEGAPTATRGVHALLGRAAGWLLHEHEPAALDRVEALEAAGKALFSQAPATHATLGYLN